MRLLIDVGNTRIKWALADASANKLLVTGVIDEDWGVLSRYVDDVTSIWASCVAADSVFDELTRNIKKLWALDVQRVKVTSAAAGIVNDYQDMSRLGVDRWVAVIGARSLVGNGALIVIDAGTAVNIEVLSADNHYQGGVILPGFSMMHDSLVGSTAGIQSNRQVVASIIGKNTSECVNSGVTFGLIGAVERVVNDVRQELGDDSMSLIIAGGDAELITANSNFELNFQPNLIFYGLMVLSKH